MSLRIAWSFHRSGRVAATVGACSDCSLFEGEGGSGRVRHATAVGGAAPPDCPWPDTVGPRPPDRHRPASRRPGGGRFCTFFALVGTPSAVGAAELRASMLGLVGKPGFREHFHPFGGQSYGASGFAWTTRWSSTCSNCDATRSHRPVAARWRVSRCRQGWPAELGAGVTKGEVG